ncbi:MAG: carboxylating nicotinate-nucleotide diphosphorylase [Deltaproteobacteria bacterium]|nr:carboxylating nicotinate-nucleotide diphosphorylase [Deltaproteobacteria bacterium]MBW2070730.1 carboxylating nicotinate-nucleotide diphosphorylase [Deltaproteobacteria bacterium]
MLTPQLESLIRWALVEDIGPGDITTTSTVPSGTAARGCISAGEPLVVAGIEVACRVFSMVDRELQISVLLDDGSVANPGDRIVELQGEARAMLSAERTALNFLQRLSGIATLTKKFVQSVQGSTARIVDTRKTTPGWRVLEKAAVRAGGGANHRFGLYDGVLIKDNHLAVVGAISEAVRAARNRIPHTVKVEVEVETLEQLEEALAAGADAVLLDNMPVSMIAAAVQRTGGRVLLEASGGVTLENVKEIAATGVDFISIGALTHSARAVDMSMEIVTETPQVVVV